MLYSLFLPYADQDQPPLNVHSICRELEAKLDALSPDTQQEDTGGPIGVRIFSDRVESVEQLWAAVEPVLPAGVFASPRA